MAKLDATADWKIDECSKHPVKYTREGDLLIAHHCSCSTGAIWCRGVKIRDLPEQHRKYNTYTFLELEEEPDVRVDT